MRMRNIGGFFRTTFHILSMYLTLLSNDRLLLRRLLFWQPKYTSLLNHGQICSLPQNAQPRVHSLPKRLFIEATSWVLSVSVKRDERTNGQKKSTDKLYIIVYLTLDTTDYRKISSDNNGRSIHRPTFRWYHTQWCVLLFDSFGPIRFYALSRKHQFYIGTMGRQRPTFNAQVIHLRALF